MYNFYKYKHSHESPIKVENNFNKNNSNLAKKHKERVKKFLFEMVAEPIQHYNYEHNIVNTREIYEKELENRYGKKPDFKLTQFITEKERIEYIKRLKAQNRNILSSTMNMEMSYTANMINDIKKGLNKSNNNINNTNESNKSKNTDYDNRPKTKKTDLPILKEREDASKNTTTENLPFFSNPENQTNEGTQRTFKFQRNLYFKSKRFNYNTLNTTSNEVKDKHKATYFKSLLSNTTIGIEHDYRTNDKHKLNLTTNFKKKKEVNDSTINSLKYNSVKRTELENKIEKVKSNTENKSKLVLIESNPETYDIFSNYPLLFNNNKAINEEKFDKELFERLKNLALRPESKEKKRNINEIGLNGKTGNLIIHSNKNSNEINIKNALKEDDYKIYIKGKIYDRRNINELSDVVLKVCNVKRGKL